ncbi:hypothetical protein [Actinotalea sp. Marseille-Q4924]|uniref:hypothetical protein n=1 Tax=Actinotalea sp. Marseille-Q4924 TaxID=2866571 RepID=UPI001CE3DD58|nr:hypothetical protein [Actinotalea sp. Marseille-Q4924]
MSRRSLALAMSLPLVAAVAAPAAAGHHGEAPEASRGAVVHQVELHALNDSGVQGKAVLVQRDGVLRVHLTARGLEPDMLHPQHIHGLPGSAEATCPPASAAGDDGVLTLVEGLPYYGGVLVDLAPYTTAPQGHINYHRTFEVTGDVADLTDEAIVVHGAFVDGQYVASLPVACGTID